MSEVPADLHEWVTFSSDDGDTWLFDLSFLTSNYHCIFGQGCLGVFTEPAPEYELGCCTYGAHFVDAEDRKSVQARISEMEPWEWEFSALAEESGGVIHKNDDGDWVTRTVDDACILANRPGFSEGPGCALHQAALRRGERPIDWKPDACWQVPLRFDHSTDDNGHTTYVLREWKRRDWGEGGAEFAWWCTDDPLAFSAGRPVYLTMREEIVELCGESAYKGLLAIIEDRLAGGGTATMLPHPQVRRAASRQ